MIPLWCFETPCSRSPTTPQVAPLIFRQLPISMKFRLPFSLTASHPSDNAPTVQKLLQRQFRSNGGRERVPFAVTNSGFGCPSGKPRRSPRSRGHQWCLHSVSPPLCFLPPSHRSARRASQHPCAERTKHNMPRTRAPPSSLRLVYVDGVYTFACCSSLALSAECWRKVRSQHGAFRRTTSIKEVTLPLPQRRSPRAQHPRC